MNKTLTEIPAYGSEGFNSRVMVDIFTFPDIPEFRSYQERFYYRNKSSTAVSQHQGHYLIL